MFHIPQSERNKKWRVIKIRVKSQLTLYVLDEYQPICSSLFYVNEKGPCTKPHKLRGGLHDGLADSET